MSEIKLRVFFSLTVAVNLLSLKAVASFNITSTDSDMEPK